MRFLKFMFTARMGFLWFTLLVFAVTLLYFALTRRDDVRAVQHPASTQTR